MAFLLLVLALAGCAPAAPTTPSALSLIPTTGARLEIREYPLVEQSADNPTHASFQNHVPAAVAALRDGWRFPNPEDALSAANQALAPYGFHLEGSSTPPFSGYSLLRDGEVVETGISHFWPVSVKSMGGQASPDFLLPYVTQNGEKLVASTAGITAWPGASAENTAPVYYGDQIAYAQTSSGHLQVYAGPSLLYSSGAQAQTAGKPEPGVSRRLFSWTQGAGDQHWALELGGRLIIDGEEITPASGEQESFGFTLVNGKPFYFATRDGLTRINYNGKVLPYVYDRVIRDQGEPLQVFNPGSNGHIVWFYALRDGLWYYVEAGVFE